MKSHEVLRTAVQEPGVKAVAASLKVSAALVYKWCEPPAHADDPEQSGARNPLDRVRDLWMLTRDIRLVRWLCNEAGGFFVANPVPEIRYAADKEAYNETVAMMRDFSELLNVVTMATSNDQYIDPHEADQIREKWEDLKAIAERFVVACEAGHYHLKPSTGAAKR